MAFREEVVARNTSPIQSGQVKATDFILMKGNKNAVKVLEVNKVASGKHGHAKVHIVGRDLFSDEKVEEVFAVTDTVLAIENAGKEVFTVLDFDRGTGEISLMDEESEERFIDAPPNGPIRDRLEGFSDSITADELGVVILNALERERIIQVLS